MVNIFSLKELKNASDDTIPAVMKKLGYVQSNTLMDVRLALGYVGVIAAALAAGYDYKVGFEKAKPYTVAGVLTYFLFYGGMNVWQYFVEGSIVYVGTKGQTTFEISSRTSNAAPTYTIVARSIRPGQKERTISRHELFTKWFDVDGNLVLEPLATWLGLVVQEAEGSAGKKSD